MNKLDVEARLDELKDETFITFNIKNKGYYSFQPHCIYNDTENEYLIFSNSNWKFKYSDIIYIGQTP